MQQTHHYQAINANMRCMKKKHKKYIKINNKIIGKAKPVAAVFFYIVSLVLYQAHR